VELTGKMRQAVKIRRGKIPSLLGQGKTDGYL
jgi:hypothetical protein